MYISRTLENEIKNNLFDRRAIIIYGARQVGKTTLVKHLLKNKNDVLWLNADEPDVKELLENKTHKQYSLIFGNKKVIIIDEAQRVKNIGLVIKIIVDRLPQYQVIATGSSSFDLANKIVEPLTGRKWEYFLIPFSFEELAAFYGNYEEISNIETRLIYGSYPAVVLNNGKEQQILKELIRSYLYRDILTFDGIKKADKIYKLLKALAFQVGSQVSYRELGQLVGIDNKTVERYIDILKQSFVIFELSAYSSNLRTELKRSKKIYFYDNGLRNAIIGDLRPLEQRDDTGKLWENYIISEFIKLANNHNLDREFYFWRTRNQQEVDLLEIYQGQIRAYEIKWNPRKKTFSRAFKTAYPDAQTYIINKNNFYEFFLTT